MNLYEERVTATTTVYQFKSLLLNVIAVVDTVPNKMRSIPARIQRFSKYNLKNTDRES